ncbi:MAG TPA: DUF4363 family protein [Candidatus Acidoferrum sp.]|nr:DUF4363 family protein [Candidatus Acidoferrum sp.]
MKRQYLALLLALLLAAAGVGNQLWYRRFTGELTNALNRVYEQVRQGDLEGADATMAGLQDYADGLEDLLDITSNHSEIDQLNESLIRTRVYLEERDMVNFEVEAARLAKLITHIYDQEKLSIGNIL